MLLEKPVDIFWGKHILLIKYISMDENKMNTGKIAKFFFLMTLFIKIISNKIR